MVNKNQTIQFKCYVNEKEYINIKNNAKACNQKISAYMRESALNPNILNCTYEEVEAHINELRSKREIINMIAYTIYKTKEYVPPDVDFVLDKLYEIIRSERKFIELMSHAKEEKTRWVAEQARKIVRQRLSESKK